MSSKRRSIGRESFVAAPPERQLPVQAPSENEIPHEEIAHLAYSFYEERQGADGSPEDDWFRAEQKLRSRQQQVQPAQVLTAGSGGSA